MATSTAPCVFMSSTCYDLGQVREDVKAFIESVGCTPMLSEYSSFPVDPDLSTVENCRAAVRDHADLFVLVVGGRYGSITEQGRSVTNTEYLEAKLKGIPIYAFVQKSVLNVLSVWRDNRSADFSRLVDSPKLFEFVDSLRGSGDIWVFPFETARDIVGTLRSQFAFLFLDSLKLRTRVKGMRLPPAIEQLKGEAFRLAVERPIAWEYRLFSRVLADALQQSATLKRDLDYGVSFEQADYISGSQVFHWIGVQLENLIRITSGLTDLVNVALPQALGPAGVPGDPEHLIYVAQRIAQGYNQAIQWSQRLKRVVVPEQLRPLVNIESRFTMDLINKVHTFSSELEKGLDNYLRNPPQEGETRVLEVNLVLEAPDLSDHEREMARVRALLQKGLLDLS